MTPPPASRRPWRFLLPAVAVAAIAGTTWLAMVHARREHREILLRQARLVARAIEPDQARSLTGSDQDLDSDRYAQLKERITAIRSVDPEIRFISLMGRTADGMPLVLVDSEPPDSEDYSPPGDEYPEASETMQAAFDGNQEAMTRPETDRWGTWISAFVPLPDVQFQGNPVLLALDIAAANWRRHIFQHAALPIGLAFIAMLLAIGVGMLQRSRRNLRERQAKLLDSERRYVDLAAQSRTVAWEIDAHGRYTFVGSAAETVFGYRPGELVGKKHCYDLHPPGDLALYKKQSFDLFARKEPFVDLENPIQTKDGRILWVSTNALPLLNADGSLRGYRGTDADITERRQAREALQHSEAQKNTILDSIPIHVVLLDKELKLLWANQTAADSVGKPRDDMVGTPCHAFWGEPDKPCNDCPAIIALRTGQGQRTLVHSPDGRFWDEQSVLILDADGQVSAIVEIAQDITERTAAEERIRALLEESNQARQALLSILEDEKQTEEKLKRKTHAQQLLIRISSSFINRPLDTIEEAIRDSLRRLAEFAGADRAYVFNYDFDAQSCSNTYEWCADGIEPQIDRLQAVPMSIVSDWLEAHRNGQPVIIPDIQALPENEARRTLEEQSIQSLITLPILESGQCVGFIGFDAVRERQDHTRHDLDILNLFAELLVNIRLRQRDEESRHRLETQLIQSQKLDSIGRLAGGVAHDFNNMLALVLGHVEMALEQTDSTRPIYASLTEIQRVAERSMVLTQQLLAFARQQTSTPQPLDLTDIVGRTIDMLRSLIGENIELDWTPAADPWTIQADPTQVEQVLTNLCINARDAIQGTGHIYIETAPVTFETPSPPRHPDIPGREFALLTVRDDGPGMDADALDHLFEPFFTTKGFHASKGLGLPMVYGIVHQHGGFIEVDSQPGQGTTFHIYWPRHVGRKKAPRLPAPARTTPPEELTILLVEDNPGMLRMTALIVASLGYAVRQASTPQEAIRIATENPGPIHLLLTDVVMPGMNGRDLEREVRAIHPALQTLFMSGYTADIITRNDVLEDSIRFLQKPFRKDVLAARIREALGLA